jgi:hypothetical protein
VSFAVFPIYDDASDDALIVLSSNGTAYNTATTATTGAGSTLNVGVMVLDSGGIPYWLEPRSGQIDTLLVSVDPTPQIDFSGGSGRLRINLLSWMSTLSRSDPRRFNSAEQQALYPGDKGLDYAAAFVDRALVFIPKSRMR